MVIIKKDSFKNFFKKEYIKYIFIFLFCVAATSSISCNYFSKKAESIANDIPFNYPGLRIETRSIKIDDIKDKYPLIVCFGDSVTFGWNLEYTLSYPSRLQSGLLKLFPQAKVINCGIGGDTVIDGLKRVNRDVLKYKPDLVVINFGLNDGMLKKSSINIKPSDGLFYMNGSYLYLPRVAIDVFEYNYVKVLEILSDNGIDALVIGINPVTDKFLSDGDESGLGKKQKEIYSVYNKRILSIAETRGVVSLNIWDTIENSGEAESYIQEDGIHPNQRGLELISSSIIENMPDF